MASTRDGAESVSERKVRALHLAPDQGVTVENPVGGPPTFKVRGDETGGSMTAYETTAAPGEGPPLHVHTNEDEVLYTLEGTIRFRLGDEVETAARDRSSSSHVACDTRGRTSGKLRRACS